MIRSVKWNKRKWLQNVLWILTISIFMFRISLPVTAAYGDEFRATVRVIEYYDMAYEVLALVNEERKSYGLNTLVMDEDLLNAAMQRAAEAHFEPKHNRTDGSRYDTVDPTGKLRSEILVRGAADGEALAMTAKDIVDAWKRSEGHYKNMMDPLWKSAGVGVVKGAVDYSKSSSAIMTFGYGSGLKEASGKSGTYTAEYLVQLRMGCCKFIPVFADGYFGIEADGTVSLEKGERVPLALLYEPCYSDGNKSSPIGIDLAMLQFTSSDPSVFSVDADGYMAGNGAGKAEITVSLKENPAISRTYSITVKEGEKQKQEDSDEAENDYKGTFTVKLAKKTYRYTGKKICPKVTVYMDRYKMDPEDYTVKYKNNKKAGTAVVTVKGIGVYEDYSGKAAFKIKKEPAVIGQVKMKSAISRKKGQVWIKWKKVKDVQGYQVQISTKKSFSSAKNGMIKGNHDTSIKIKKLKSGKKYYVRIRGWKKMNRKYRYGRWGRITGVQCK